MAAKIVNIPNDMRKRTVIMKKGKTPTKKKPLSSLKYRRLTMVYHYRPCLTFQQSLSIFTSHGILPSGTPVFTSMQ